MQRICLLILIFIVFSLKAAFGLAIEIEPKVVAQGKTLCVKVVSAEGISQIEGRFLGQIIPFYKKGSDFKGLIGIPIEQKPGKFNMDLILTDVDGQIKHDIIQQKIIKTKFPLTHYWLKPKKKKLLARDLISEEWARIEKKIVREDLIQHWRGKYVLPVKGEISQLFGSTTVINGKRGGSHRGMDLAVPIGTKVMAPNQGKVVFAEKLKAFGGTMVLDHGQGIYTLYFHLSKFISKVGEEVGKGEAIALTGNSGISSGPHLHWGMSVHNLRVDPWQWTKQVF